MFKFLKNLNKRLSDGDERYYTEKEANSNSINIPYEGNVVVSVNRKRLYWNNSNRYEIYEYALNGNAILIKQIQLSFEKDAKHEKEFWIKNGEVCVEGIYKRYNNPNNWRKEPTLEEEIEKFKRLCLLNPLCNMRLTMFILSKSLNTDSLHKAVDEKIKVMNKGRENYNKMLSELGLTYTDEYFDMEKQIKKKGIVKEYDGKLSSIIKKCGCSSLELIPNFRETIENIKSYLK